MGKKADPSTLDATRLTDGYIRTVLEQHGVRARGVSMTRSELESALVKLGAKRGDGNDESRDIVER